jgi:transposase
MEKYEDVVGINVSKLTIDAYLYKRGLHRLFSNTYKGYVALVKWTAKNGQSEALKKSFQTML